MSVRESPFQVFSLLFFIHILHHVAIEVLLCQPCQCHSVPGSDKCDAVPFSLSHSVLAGTHTHTCQYYVTSHWLVREGKETNVLNLVTSLTVEDDRIHFSFVTIPLTLYYDYNKREDLLRQSYNVCPPAYPTTSLTTCGDLGRLASTVAFKGHEGNTHSTWLECYILTPCLALSFPRLKTQCLVWILMIFSSFSLQ